MAFVCVIFSPFLLCIKCFTLFQCSFVIYSPVSWVFARKILIAHWSCYWNLFVLCVVHPFYQNLWHFLRISSQFLLTVQVAYIAYVSSGDLFIASQFFVGFVWYCEAWSISYCYGFLLQCVILIAHLLSIFSHTQDADFHISWMPVEFCLVQWKWYMLKFYYSSEFMYRITLCCEYV